MAQRPGLAAPVFCYAAVRRGATGAQLAGLLKWAVCNGSSPITERPLERPDRRNGATPMSPKGQQQDLRTRFWLFFEPERQPHTRRNNIQHQPTTRHKRRREAQSLRIRTKGVTIAAIQRHTTCPDTLPKATLAGLRLRRHDIRDHKCDKHCPPRG
jgi:hypothetical protein